LRVDPGGELLFLRVPPVGMLVRHPGSRSGRLASMVRAEGVQGTMGVRRVSCFWVGLGRHVRQPGPGLLERLRQGAIDEVLDIGCAGALDPSLRRGDLVLSVEDLPFDSRIPVEVLREPAARETAHEVAEARGVRAEAAPILTHERAVLSRADRLDLFEQTGCAAVQMEHAWFLLLLKRLLPARVVWRIRVTHLVLITDAVPDGERGVDRVRASWDAIRGYALPGPRGILSLRREFLTRWLPG
jgi:hypothetical protein